jgi:hypothetical protein
MLTGSGYVTTPFPFQKGTNVQALVVGFVLLLASAAMWTLPAVLPSTDYARSLLCDRVSGGLNVPGDMSGSLYRRTAINGQKALGRCRCLHDGCLPLVLSPLIRSTRTALEFRQMELIALFRLH